jgi:hypothetical protein
MFALIANMENAMNVNKDGFQLILNVSQFVVMV